MNGSGEGISRFPFIESHMNAATQFGVLKPLQHKEGAFKASDFAQRQSESVLAGIGAQFSEQQRRRDRARRDGGSHP